MELFTLIKPLREHLLDAKKLAPNIGFVPTMGALHEGHLELVRHAKRLCSHVVVSIFVNPAQFNRPNDLESYPRNLKQDLELLQKAGVRTVFAPDEIEIYGEKFDEWLTPPSVAERLEGSNRPGHFRGVVTVVNIFFRIIEPETAFFGEKDFQQVRVIEEMVKDLRLPIKIVRVPTVREADGLAMSSRNTLLTPSERKDAALISRGLFAAKEFFLSGERRADLLIEKARQQILTSSNIKIDYLEIVDELALKPVTNLTVPSRIMVAAYVGKVRLIDNVALAPWSTT